MDGGGQYNPRTVEEVFRDFKGRRAGMIKALTTDVEDFYQQCDPEKGKVCLYGFPSEQWEVKLPAEEGPPDVPEPALGINFARDGMQEKDWLSLVAVHSDAWLLAVAFYFGARFGFDKADRKRLFSMTNDLPTIPEVVTGTAKKQVKEKSVRDFLYWRDPEVLCSLSSDLALIELGPRVHLGFGPTGASTSAEMTTPPTVGGPQQPQSSDDVPPVSTHPRTQDNPSTQQHPKPK